MTAGRRRGPMQPGSANVAANDDMLVNCTFPKQFRTHETRHSATASYSSVSTPWAHSYRSLEKTNKYSFGLCRTRTNSHPMELVAAFGSLRDCNKFGAFPVSRLLWSLSGHWSWSPLHEHFNLWICYCPTSALKTNPPRHSRYVSQFGMVLDSMCNNVLCCCWWSSNLRMRDK